MGLETHFTPKGQQNELPFTIITGTTESQYILFSKTESTELRYPLVNDDGLLRLSTSENPFEEDVETVNDRLAGLSTDLIELRAQGLESEGVFDILQRPGYGPDQIFVENKPFSLRQLNDLIEDGDIELAPDFQRNFIWDRTRQSRLIESILLGLPLPSIYLSQYPDGRLTVVDGLQRLSTIRAFFKNELVLTNLEYLHEYSGMNFEHLKSVLSPLRMRRFGQTQVLCFVIDYRSPNELKFDLFRRLNTGGRPLNNQEIRNCLTRPFAQRILKEMISLSSFREATGGSVTDTRMDAREAAMRFIYFTLQYSNANPIGNYNGDMETTLDLFVDEINNMTEASLSEYIFLYDKAMQNCYYLFGNYCFRKVKPDGLRGRRTPVNKLLMLTWSVLLSKYNRQQIERLQPSGGLLEPLANMIDSDDSLFNVLTWSTNAKYNIDYAFRSFQNLLDSHITATE